MIRKSILAAILCLTLAAPALAAPEPMLPVLRGPAPPESCVLKEDRSERYANLLAVSAKVMVEDAAGSGTICHYDDETGWAYVLSCGHLWEGGKKYDGSTSPAKVSLWYESGAKLDSPKTYKAEALFWSNTRGYDVSLLRFKPDVPPRCAHIASRFSPTMGSSLNSMGCDGGREVARYEVIVQEMSDGDLRTRLNSPRPGRSGGGLLTDDGVLVGVCWGTSDTSSGDGTGFFTPLLAIRKTLSANGHAWLLEDEWDARNMPIVNHLNPDERCAKDFIPLPANR